jgi:voltage-dependent potassium channel beta subunit
MHYRRLGKSGLQVSALSLGSWVTFGKQVDEGVARACMHAAYDAGVNFFDNAETYANGASEEVMGRILADAGWDRTTYLVSSKVFWGGDKPNQKGLSRKHVVEACHAALRRLRVEYLDLYFCHRPDDHTPVEETVRAMHDLIQQGKVLYWGTSEWSAQQIQEAYGIARALHLTPPTMEQPQYHLLHRERVEGEYRRLYDRANLGLGLTTWSPLASGLLTGKYNDGIPADSRLAQNEDLAWLRERLLGPGGAENLDKVRRLGALAAELGLPLSRLALAWCLTNPHVSTVITGASRVEQVRENMTALAAVPLLTPEVVARIEEIVANRPVVPTF